VPTWVLSQAVGASYKSPSRHRRRRVFAGYRRHLGLLLGATTPACPAPCGEGERLGTRAARASWCFACRRPTSSDRAPGNESLPRRFLGYLSRSPDLDRRRVLAPPPRGAERQRPSARFRELHQGPVRRPASLPHCTSIQDLPRRRCPGPDDRVAMAHSLEIRVPLVDHELVERVFPLPDHVKIGFGRTSAAEAALKPRLPEPHLHRAETRVRVRSPSGCATNYAA